MLGQVAVALLEPLHLRRLEKLIFKALISDSRGFVVLLDLKDHFELRRNILASIGTYLNIIALSPLQRDRIHVCRLMLNSNMPDISALEPRGHQIVLGRSR